MSAVSSPSLLSASASRRVMPPSIGDAPVTRRVASERLRDGRREPLIRHQGSECRLRLTRNDKLMLTKCDGHAI